MSIIYNGHYFLRTGGTPTDVLYEALTEEADRRELNSLLDELERRQLYYNREQLTEIVFSPARDGAEPWTARMGWLLDGELAAGFGFHSRMSRQADRAHWLTSPVMWDKKR